MSNEPKVKNVIDILSSEFFDYENLIEMKEEMLEVIYFFSKENINTLYNAILIESESTKEKIFDNIMSLYPMSKPIVEKMIEANPSSTKKIIELYDKGEIITRELNILIQIIRRSSRENPKILVELEERKNQLELEIQKCKEDIDKLKKSEKKEKDLINEVNKLKDEYRALEESYSKEALEEQKLQLNKKINERQKLKDEFDRQKSEIIGIEKELKNIKNGNDSFKKSLKELSKVVKVLNGGR